MDMKRLILMAVVLSTTIAFAQTEKRWQPTTAGGIVWNVADGDSHMDHVEMSGLYNSSIVHYGVENGALKTKYHLVFPMLRTIPNNTHGSLAFDVEPSSQPDIMVMATPVEEFPINFGLKGILTSETQTDLGLRIKHQWFPSTDQPAFIHQRTIINEGEVPISVLLSGLDSEQKTAASKGVNGSYVLRTKYDKTGYYELKSEESVTVSVVYSAHELTDSIQHISANYELKKRTALIDQTFTDLEFNCPDPALNQIFNFAKLRAVESIYHTKGGLMHGPGGGRYYAAIWANDQAEYANPFFPFLGNAEGTESAINSFRHFARFMNDEFEPIPSSIVAEGIDIWNGAGDRGDMAMIAYGASRFALTYGDKTTAKDLWPLIEWCLEYCERKLTKEGVVASDCDELENRFPAGDANLNTSCLYYDALISAAYLSQELGDSATAASLNGRSEKLFNAIESHFGNSLKGFDTYRYYEGNTTLRAWICTPLTVGIYTRAKGTMDALFSENLWTDDGLASEEGSTTFWDRATLYALRGVFAAGYPDKGLEFLSDYSNRRLYGEHVPYPVEAYPEGNQRHLSAESALYCRVITEGLFGIRPTGFSSFNLTPNLPSDWNFMTLRNVQAFGKEFNLEVSRFAEDEPEEPNEPEELIEGEMPSEPAPRITVENPIKIELMLHDEVMFETVISNGSTVNIDLNF